MVFFSILIHPHTLWALDDPVSTSTVAIQVWCWSQIDTWITLQEFGGLKNLILMIITTTLCPSVNLISICAIIMKTIFVMVIDNPW